MSAFLCAVPSAATSNPKRNPNIEICLALLAEWPGGEAKLQSYDRECVGALVLRRRKNGILGALILGAVAEGLSVLLCILLKSSLFICSDFTLRSSKMRSVKIQK